MAEKLLPHAVYVICEIYDYVESSNKECQEQYVQIGVNEESFHLINVFLLKTCSNTVCVNTI